MSPGRGWKPASGWATPSVPRTIDLRGDVDRGCRDRDRDTAAPGVLDPGSSTVPPGGHARSAGERRSPSARQAQKTRAVPPPRTPLQTRLRFMRAPRTPPRRRSGSRGAQPPEPPEARAIAGHDQPERDRAPAPPRTPPTGRWRSGSSPGSRAPAACRPRAPRPSAGSGGGPPVLVGAGPDLEAALAVRAVQLQAHGSPGGWRIRRRPVRAGVMVRRRPLVRWGRCRPRHPPTGASPG